MKIFIFGLGHLSKFLMNELSESYTLDGTWREPKDGFDRINKSIKYNAPAELPAEIDIDYDWVIWSFPPVFGYMETLVKADMVFKKNIPWIFISSTSVFSEGVVDESSERNGTRFRGENLVDIENTLKKLDRKVSIIRPSGLVDEKRNPTNFFKNSAREPAVKGETTNLVHTRDVARFINFVIESNLKGEDFNLNSSTQVEKSKFYNELLVQRGFEQIKFQPTTQANPKVVSSKKSRDKGFEYLFDDLLEFFKRN